VPPRDLGAASRKAPRCPVQDSGSAARAQLHAPYANRSGPVPRRELGRGSPALPERASPTRGQCPRHVRCRGWRGRAVAPSGTVALPPLAGTDLLPRFLPVCDHPRFEPRSRPTGFRTAGSGSCSRARGWIRTRGEQQGCGPSPFQVGSPEGHVGRARPDTRPECAPAQSSSAAKQPHRPAGTALLSRKTPGDTAVSEVVSRIFCKLDHGGGGGGPLWATRSVVHRTGKFIHAAMRRASLLCSRRSSMFRWRCASRACPGWHRCWPRR
jgi:hypothetical protein